MDFSDKRALILGLAREGDSLARFLAERGARVTVTDVASSRALDARARGLSELGVRLVLGGQHPGLVGDADLFFVSPGVPEDNPIYLAAIEVGLEIQSMSTLFFDLCPGSIVGVTGSSGKTTTTGLIGEILACAGVDAVVGGNIGDPMIGLLAKIGTDTVVVLELSSFQLSILGRSPHISVVTNITPNHLDRHGTMEGYIAAKRSIVAHQTSADFAVLNASDAHAMDFARGTQGTIRWFGESIGGREGADVENGAAGVFAGGEFHPVVPIDEIPLLGAHNVENVLAAIAATAILGVRHSAMAAAVRRYRTPAHRLQTVRERAGVRYVDDSIATSPARAAVALQAISDPVILIAGGRDKSLPWDDFARLVPQKARALFLIGEAAPLIESAVMPHLGGPERTLDAGAIHRCSTLCDAVAQAAGLARPGDVVLLSPGCASYDMFADYEERGAVFVRAVEALDAA